MQSKGRPAPVVGRDGLAGSRGSSVSASQTLPTVEIDSTFAQAVGLNEGAKVGIYLHVDPPLAHTINIEPLTPTDWEMIELHAGFLEVNFLHQIRALPNPAYSSSEKEHKLPPHPITLHLSPTSTASVTVASLSPAPPANSPFAKISPDAEVIVAPKTRRSERGSDRSSRSVTSNGRKSTGSKSTIRRKSSGDRASKGVVFLRGVSRVLGDGWFDEDDAQMEDRGLKVWVDRDVLLTKALRGVTWVTVSVVRPAGLIESADPQKDAAEPEKPTNKVIARLGVWDDIPDNQHIGLSTLLCDVLSVEGIVGGLVRIEAAPPQVAKARSIDPETKEKEVKKPSSREILKILPFATGASQSSPGIRFGGDSKQEREAALQKLKSLLGKGTEGNGLLEGPLTDGMLLPACEGKEYSWQGGILRFDPPPPADGQKSPVHWLLGSERNLPIEVQAEIAKPTSALKSWSPGEALPASAPVLVGIDSLIEQLSAHLTHSSSVLLTGGAGSGKTNLSQLIAHRLRNEYLYHTTYFPCRTLVTDETRVSSIKETLNRIFGSAAWGARLGGRAIVILDDLDRLCPVETELQVADNSRSRHISECLIATVRQYCTIDSNIVLLATAQSKEAVNNVIIGGHVVREILDLAAPNKDGRRKVLEMLVRKDAVEQPAVDESKRLTHHRSISTTSSSLPSRPGTSNGPPTSVPAGFVISPTVDFLDLAGQTDGYMPGDLVLLVSRARSECLIRSIATNPNPSHTPTLTLTAADFTAALKDFTPSSLRNVTLQKSTVPWSSIGGLHETRKTLLETLQYPTTYAPIFSSCPLRLRSGLLLYGYPGSGKTLLASAIASQCGLNFISIKGPELLNKYIGASEAAVRSLFQRAQAARPCILFFDEFDSIAPKRGHDSTGVTDRVVNQLLTQMDGAEGLGDGVYVLAATSRPDLIDPALLRPGRLDKSLLCGMPDGHERVDILKAVSQKVRVSREVGGGWEWIAEQTEGWTGADLQALVYNAQLEAVHDVLDDRDLDFGGKKKRLNGATSANGQAKGGGGVPEFTSFRLGEQDLEYDDEVGPKALAERVKIAAKLRELQAARRKQKLDAKKEQEAQLQQLQQHQRAHGHHRTSSAYFDSSPPEEQEPAANGEGGEEAGKEPVIEWKHIEGSLKSTRPSVSAQERRRLEGIYREFVAGRSGDLPSGGASMEIGGRTSLM